MGDIGGNAGGEDGENVGISKASGVCGAVLDLGPDPESVSTHMVARYRVWIYLGAVERGARASGIGDYEGVFGERAQDPTGIFEELDSLVAGVDDGRGDSQVLQSINLDVWDRCLDGQAGSSVDDDHRRGEEDESSTEGREHCNGCSQSGWRDGSNKAFGLNEPVLMALRSPW